jgi:hypothetical protein
MILTFFLKAKARHSGLGFQKNNLKTYGVVPSSPGSGKQRTEL